MALRPKNDKYSRHNDSTPRVVAGIARFPHGDAMTRPLIAEIADVSLPTVSTIVLRLIGESLVRESGMVLGRNEAMVMSYERTDQFDDAVADNPEWQRAIRITSSMAEMALTEGELLDMALDALERERNQQAE